MRVVVARRRSAPADGSCPSFSRVGRFLPSGAVLALSLILALGLLLPAWTPGALVSAQTASIGVPPSPAVSPSPGVVPSPSPVPSPSVPATSSASNIDPDLQRQMAASPTQLLAVVVELKPLAAPFPPRANELLAQRSLALLTRFGVPVGGLALINSAAGFANAAGIRAISLDPQVAYIYADAVVHPSSSPGWQVPLSTAYPRSVNADRVWWQGAAGGVSPTVAVLDSGINPDVDLVQPNNRLLAAVNFAGDKGGMADAGGHGTHVAGIVAGNGFGSSGEYIGIAPSTNLIDVRVINRVGGGRISSVVRGIEWCLAHRAQYNIRVINLSLGMPARTSYRLNPLDAAVEIAWMRGIAVVAAAGNGGPAQGTVDSPGDDPYVITVGATDDRGTAGNGDDVLAPFSAWGTPPGSTAKPDLVAPGRRMVSLRVPGSYLDTHYPERVTPARSGASYFRLSGTSMSTPVVSGAAALMLQQQPNLSPDRLKTLAMGTTQGYGWNAGGPAVPDVRADGYGLVDAWAATYGGPQDPAHAQYDQKRRHGDGTSTPRPIRQSFRPADTVARSLYQLFYGGPLAWKDPNYLGISWTNASWTNLAWDNLAWDNLAWDNLAWDNLAWDNLAWDNLAWDNLAWDNLAWDNLAWDSSGKTD